MSIRIGILEDDSYVMEELLSIVKSSRKLEYVMAASSAEQFLKYYNKNTNLDILLSDIGLPGISGIEAIMKIKNITPDVQIIILSSFHDNDTIFKALRAGATGYLLKDTPFEEIERKLVEAKEGTPALSPAIASRMINYFGRAKISNDDFKPTTKEEEVLQLLIEGLSYKLIAAELNLSIDGIRYHVKKIYKKLHINSRPELMKMYVKKDQKNLLS